MTPKEKAQELVNKYLKEIEIGLILVKISESLAKQCALIAVDEILNALDSETIIYGSNYCFEENKYWQEVKEEIEKQ